MGQYYKPMSVEKKQFVYSHDYNNGLKLMEHSYIDNNFVAAVETLIGEGGAWYGDRIVWAGDYADPEKRKNGKPTKRNLYDFADEQKNPDCKLMPVANNRIYRYVMNLDTKEFVDKDKVPVCEVCDGYEWRIHPLPLLTCEGNGRGGGDYRGESPLIGKWARNRVIVSEDFPPADFKEIIFDLVE